MDKSQIAKLRKICSNITVLYIEDDEDIAKQVFIMLGKIFKRVEVKYDGEEGLEAYKKHKHDIVITDITMPKLNGIDMSKAIKMINPEQSILITSAYNNVQYLTTLIDLGIDKFVLKPINMQNFLTAISNLAIKIYREKREVSLEAQLKRQNELQMEILNSISFPIVYFKNNTIIYANNIFTRRFLTPSDVADISYFKLGYLFEDKSFVTLSNENVIQKIINSDLKNYQIVDINRKILKNYHIFITTLGNLDSYLVSFINLDTINTQIDRFSLEASYFPKREAFKERISIIKHENKENEYAIYCVGLKNIKKFLSKYGGAKMHSIYEVLALSFKEEFMSEFKSQNLFVFLFETNRYIFIAKKTVAFSKRLDNFGIKYSYNFGNPVSLRLEYAQEPIESDAYISSIIEISEKLLYSF